MLISFEGNLTFFFDQNYTVYDNKNKSLNIHYNFEFLSFLPFDVTTNQLAFKNSLNKSNINFTSRKKKYF